ncbi:MAG: ABC transporter ATP-binding protein [Gammaproteobacteria bacterium]
MSDGTVNDEPVREAAPLACCGLTKFFDEGGVPLEVLRGVDLTVRSGETVAIIGESGAGKTTLLQLLGGLDEPTDGTVTVFRQDLATLTGKARGVLRNRTLGFVYQFHHLLPEFTALENVAMPLLLRRDSLADVRARAARLLDRVGLGGRLAHRPGELSGGERQRVAVARALVTDPAVVLADEPTGNLDHKSGELTLKLMLELNAESGASLVIVTHSHEIAARMDRVMELIGGRLIAVS